MAKDEALLAIPGITDLAEAEKIGRFGFRLFVFPDPIT
jgi:hypothetical protein